jgi:hypothetical protein
MLYLKSLSTSLYEREVFPLFYKEGLGEIKSPDLSGLFLFIAFNKLINKTVIKYAKKAFY